MTRITAAMTRIAVATLVLMCMGPVWGAEAPGAGPVGDEPRPVPAAEAEQRVAKTRDVLTELLWIGTEPYWHTGRWDECMRLCRQVIEIDPHFVEVYVSLAWMLWSQDRDEEAIAVYQSAIRDNPDNWQVYHAFGMYYYSRRRYEKAAEQLRRASALGAPRTYCHMLPNALEKAGRKEEALKEWRALLERFPDDPVAKRRAARLEEELRKKARRTA